MTLHFTTIQCPRALTSALPGHLRRAGRYTDIDILTGPIPTSTARLPTTTSLTYSGSVRLRTDTIPSASLRPIIPIDRGTRKRSRSRPRDPARIFPAHREVP